MALRLLQEAVAGPLVQLLAVSLVWTHTSLPGGERKQSPSFCAHGSHRGVVRGWLCSDGSPATSQAGLAQVKPSFCKWEVRLRRGESDLSKAT